jgi:hypothetical protein
MQAKSVATLMVIAFGTAALATCYKNTNPSTYSCCSPDTPTAQSRTTQDQKAQQAAYTYCLAKCTNDTQNCVFEVPANTGCVSSGSYSNVWVATAPGQVHRCDNGATYYTYSYDGINPTQQGETVKYIADNMNCAPGS